MIGSFTGPHQFLSNFYLAEIDFEDATYASVEHAYQAAKTRDRREREQVRRAKSPGAAKRAGRRVILRPDWDSIKIEVMRRLVRQKFYTDSVLAGRLRATGAQELIEGNSWNDTFWGQCPLGVGFNHLGKILMEVRGELRDGS